MGAIYRLGGRTIIFYIEAVGFFFYIQRKKNSPISPCMYVKNRVAYSYMEILKAYIIEIIRIKISYPKKCDLFIIIYIDL